MRHQIKNGLACFGNGRGIILAENAANVAAI
jgi:hypothetical protein